MIVNALDGRELPVYGDGLNVRDWLYVEDHCRALERVLIDGAPGETYNVGGRCERRNIDVVRLLCRSIDEVIGTDRTLARRFPRCPAAGGNETASLIAFVPDRPGHDRRYAIDATKIERELGFMPQQDFEAGIRATLEWYLANQPWWRRVMDGTYRDWIVEHYGSSAG